MADERKEGPDRERIKVDEDADVRRWAEQFGVSAEEIRSAVEAAGPLVEDVRRRLGANRSY